MQLLLFIAVVLFCVSLAICVGYMAGKYGSG
jgi:hypothetical protein